jgi:hypothetical protein
VVAAPTEDPEDPVGGQWWQPLIALIALIALLIALRFGLTYRTVGPTTYCVRGTARGCEGRRADDGKITQRRYKRIREWRSTTAFWK